jgi:hypothetical protein
LALLKHVLLTNTVLTQCYYSYANHSDAILLPDGVMPIKFQKNHGNLAFEAFCRSIEPLQRTKITKEEYVLLKTLIFCYPAAKSISDKGRKVLEKEFEHYSKILLHHIQAQLGNASGAVKYAQVIGILEAMTHFSQKHRDLHLIMRMSHYHKRPELVILTDAMN